MNIIFINKVFKTVKQLKNKVKILAFTLIELLAVVSIILILTGFLVTIPPKMEQKAKIAKTEHLLKNIADGIKSFEEDFNELPPSTSYLLSANKIIEFAASKNVQLASPEPYLTNVPEIYYGNYAPNWFHCPLYDPLTDENLHAHNVPPHAVHDSIGGTNPPWGWKKFCKDCISNGGVATCVETLVRTPVLAFSGSVGGTIVKPEIPLCADNFGSLIFYLPDFTKNTFMIISKGPDLKSSLSTADYLKYINGGSALSYTPNSDTDKDNVIYQFND